MVYSLLEVDNWEFRRVNKYLEQVLADIKEETIDEIKKIDKMETFSTVEKETVQEISKRK
ncbi:MAG: hypothetical protein WC942_06725 [Clostridia bacterium]|jgi:putative heme iron utilization protein